MFNQGVAWSRCSTMLYFGHSVAFLVKVSDRRRGWSWVWSKHDVLEINSELMWGIVCAVILPELSLICVSMILGNSLAERHVWPNVIVISKPVNTQERVTMLVGFPSPLQWDPGSEVLLPERGAGIRVGSLI